MYGLTVANLILLTVVSLAIYTEQCDKPFAAARPITQSLPHTMLRPSVSAGVGLIYRFDPIRVEVNFGVPLAANKSDAMRRGVQVGIGLEYL